MLKKLPTFCAVQRCATVAMALLGLAGCAKTIPIVEVPDSQPPALDNPAATKSIAMDRVVMQVPRGQQIGAISMGVLCVPHLAVTIGGGQADVTDANYLKIVYDEFANRRYRVSNSPTELFQTVSAEEADLRIGARVTDYRVNICYPMGGFGNLSDGTAESSIAMEWQLFDVKRKAIVMKTETRGFGRVTQSTTNPGIVASDTAIGVATRHLLSSPAFAQAMNAPLQGALPGTLPPTRLGKDEAEAALKDLASLKQKKLIPEEEYQNRVRDILARM